MGVTTTPLTIADEKILRGETPTKEEYELSHRQIMDHCQREIIQNNAKMIICTWLFVLFVIALIIWSVL